MKNNLKALELVEKGLSSKTISKLTESQINVLHKKLVEQQSGVSTTQNVVKTTKIPSTVAKTTGANVDGINISQDGSGNVYAKKQTEGELGEETELDEKDMNNPWAICHKKLGPKKTAKFERCVKHVKKTLEEGKNPLSLFLENKIMRIVEKHLPPKISKGDLIKFIVEGKPGVAEPKPGTKQPKPGTKQPPKTKPSHPGKNPNPGVNPAPKAVSPEKAKDEVLDLILNILNNGEKD